MKNSKSKFRWDETSTPKVKFTPPEESKIKDIVKKTAEKAAEKIAMKHVKKSMKSVEKKLEAADKVLFEKIVVQINHDIQAIVNQVMNYHLDKFHDDQLKHTSDEKVEPGSPSFSATILIPTPAGDKFVTELKPGDMVYGPRGKYLVINSTGGYEPPSKDPVDINTNDENEPEDDEDPFYPASERG